MRRKQIDYFVQGTEPFRNLTALNFSRGTKETRELLLEIDEKLWQLVDKLGWDNWKPYQPPR